MLCDKLLPFWFEIVYWFAWIVPGITGLRRILLFFWKLLQILCRINCLNIFCKVVFLPRVFPKSKTFLIYIFRYWKQVKVILCFIIDCQKGYGCCFTVHYAFIDSETSNFLEDCFILIFFSKSLNFLPNIMYDIKLLLLWKKDYILLKFFKGNISKNNLCLSSEKNSFTN
jgi:hypothetical protein